MAPLAAQMWASFQKWATLIWLPLLPTKQFYKHETFSLYKFIFCYRISVLQSFTQGLFSMALALPRLLVLYKNQQTLFLFFFLFEKGMTERVPVKGNCVVSGPSLVTETYRLPFTVRKILLYCFNYLS